ncbi:hypothetical protein OG756_39390 [Streptomyces sp. NBC_01310]|uniref:hypothetical protein n=1 Tax=Streptomyces sp. NBC_01310 TaxID=2903820 RepID=UPI0035B654C8|nr:hypothetical protein OG756_39390 [Streptomyces sp. NBC_01310]
MTGVRGPGSGVRGPGSGVRGPGSGVRGPGSGVRLDGTATPLRARTVIDATGRARWLSRALGLTAPLRSPRLLIRYGYAAGSCPQRDAAPAIAADRTGWTWTARVGRARYQWMTLAFAHGFG